MPVPVPDSLPAGLIGYLADKGRQAVFLDFVRAEATDPRATQLGGLPYIPQGEGWPSCPGCGRPLHHLFQLNFQQAGLPVMGEVALLAFFYCVDCAPVESEAQGWRVIARTDLTAPPAHLSPPAVPPQEAQSGLVVMLGGPGRPAVLRTGGDLPGSFYQELQPLFVGEPLPPEEAKYDRVITGKLLSPETGEQSDLWIPCTPGTDPTEIIAMLSERAVGELQIQPFIPRRDYTDAYRKFVDHLRGATFGPVISKIGGWLECCQEPWEIRCRCGAKKVHVATISAAPERIFAIGDSGALYLVACPQCDDGEIGWWVDYH